MCWNRNEGKLSIGGFLLRLILVIIFVLLLIWLCPMLNIKSHNSSVFNDNIDRMREAATSYFTNERLPKEVGESTKITLEEMVNNKLLLPVLDSRGRTCNEEKSYVEIDKKATEYVMTIYLSCEDQADFIEVHMGCYDKCDKFDLSTQTIEYQFKRTYKKVTKVAYCPNSYTLKNGKCQKATIDADYKDLIETTSCQTGYTLTNGVCIASKNTTTDKICPEGYELNSAKTACTKSNTSYESLITSYSCPSGYVRSGTKCTKDTTVFSGYTNMTSTYLSQSCDSCESVVHYLYATSLTSSTSCPTGYSKTSDGTKCYKTTSSTTSLICPAEYNEVNGVCTRTSTVTTKVTKTYSCPANYTKEDSLCVKTNLGTLTTKVLYKSKTVTKTSYKWSTSSSISGWMATGKTRATSTTCACGC
ncbi:MAG TPA: hypothetical protein PLT65_05645 [Bacilli bacterium]|nr:hypothetical protein [Bacilli bacterium]